MDHPAAPGKRRRTFLLVRYVLIIAIAALAIIQEPGALPEGIALLILASVASNVALAWVAPDRFFHWSIQGPLLLADTLWVSVILVATNLSQEFFLFFFVLLLAAMSESLALLAVGALCIGAASVVLAGDQAMTAPTLMRPPFFFAAAIFYGYIVDMTKQERRISEERGKWAKQLEHEVRARTRELERQSTQLRALYSRALEANRLKSEFVANMSHELRSPLNLIIGYSDLLLSGEFGALEEDAGNVCAHIHHSATSLHRLLENMLDFAKLEQQQVTIRLSEVNVYGLVRAAVANVCQPHPAGLELDMELPAHLPAIETDAQKLTAILTQLLSNAIKFTPAGGRVTVSAENLADVGRLKFTVCDSGAGISPAHLQLIFEDFRQIDGTSTRAHGGVGLGLALVRRYLALLEGQIHVASELGHGSTFSFTLPHRLGAQPDQLQPLSAPDPPPATVRLAS